MLQPTAEVPSEQRSSVDTQAESHRPSCDATQPQVCDSLGLNPKPNEAELGEGGHQLSLTVCGSQLQLDWSVCDASNGANVACLLPSHTRDGDQPRRPTVGQRCLCDASPKGDADQSG